MNQHFIRAIAPMFLGIAMLAKTAWAEEGVSVINSDSKQNSNSDAESLHMRNYASRIIAKIKPNIIFAEAVEGNPRVEVLLFVETTGKIVWFEMTKASGLASWDEAVLEAIKKTKSIPLDVDGFVPSKLAIGFRMKD